MFNKPKHELVGIVQQDTRRATAAIKELQQIGQRIADCEFEAADLMVEIDESHSWISHYDSFKQMVEVELGMSERQAQYRMRISRACKALGIDSAKQRAARISKLREIFTLDHTRYGDEIKRLVDMAATAPLETIKSEVRKAKGLAGEEEFIPRHFMFLKSANDVVDLAIAEARKRGDTIDSDGQPKEKSDSQCIADICMDFLSGAEQLKHHLYPAIQEEQ